MISTKILCSGSLSFSCKLHYHDYGRICVVEFHLCVIGTKIDYSGSLGFSRKSHYHDYGCIFVV